MRNLFLPESYQRQVSYRTDPLYKGTWYLLQALLLCQLVILPVWFFNSRNITALRERAASAASMRESVTNQMARMSATVEQFDKVKALESEIRQRYPVSLILAAIQRSIPREAGLIQLTVDDARTKPGASPIPKQGEEPAFLINVEGVIQGANPEGTIQKWIAGLSGALPGKVVTSRKPALAPFDAGKFGRESDARPDPASPSPVTRSFNFQLAFTPST